ncbi:MAG: hypothetical protein JZU47_14910 [Prolixibacteraceae bacterium]|nr:hypothetical protein [Prolixibacteraceae bacterium]
MVDLKTYKLGWVFLIFFFLIEFQAESQEVLDTGDSIRQSILFRTHLLIQPDEMPSELIDSLLKSRVPLALESTGKSSEWANKLTDRMHRNVLPLVIISADNHNFPNRTNKKLLVLDLAELQRFGPERQLQQSSFLWIETLPDSMWQIGRFIEIWEQNGRMPNFVSPPNDKIQQTIAIVKALNSHSRIFGVVRNGDQLLTDVSWKEYPGRKTSGFFSFPIGSDNHFALAPYKSGYRFSPDIILPSPENLQNLKVFNALPLDPDFGLTDRFTFSGKVRNLYRKNDNEIILYGLDFAKDAERGNCAFFAGKAYLDGGLKSCTALKSNFSITAWIKPTELGNNNCILAKGKDFVLKIHQGELTFTVQGVKDYRSARTMIPVNRWSFVSLVHSEADNHIRFYLNGELTEQVQLLTPYNASDYTMLIGSNLWEEFFKGYMSEIKIWERELNDEEIRNEFTKRNDSHFSLSRGWLLGIFLFLLALGFLLRRRLLPKETENHPKKLTAPEPGKPKVVAEQISCFGGLKVFTPEGKDISLKFSPKIKQLFVLILLHSVGGRKGISSNKLSDCLWPGVSPQNAKNIRGTNIQNLKALLAPCAGMKLVFQDKLWLLEFAENYFVDYAFAEAKLIELESNTDEEKLVEELADLLPILKKGTLFPNMSESWVDPYINAMSNRILEFGLNVFRLLNEEKHGSLLLEVAEVLSLNDSLNEPALRKKISILTRQGKLSLAHSVFDNFTKLYLELYQEKYSGDFKSLIDND